MKLLFEASFMEQKTPIVKKQLSSSLRERLKKCGRYHASPTGKSDISTGTGIDNSQQPLKISTSQCNDKVVYKYKQTNMMYISPLSRKRCSTPDLDEVINVKRLHSDIGILGIKNHVESHDENSKKNYTDIEEKECNKSKDSSDQPLEVNKTPLTSRSRFKHNTLKTNRLTFQDREDRCCSSDIKVGGISSDSSQMPTKETKENYDGVTGNEGHDINSGAMKMSAGNEQQSTIPSTHSELLKEIAEKEERLRKLKMVKTYRAKNDLTELQVLIDKWRHVSQQALQDLHSEMPDPKPTLTQLVDHLGIEHELLNFDAEEETFE